VGQQHLAAALFAPLSLLASRSLRGGSSLTAPLLEALAGETLITILHTNDTHSQIDPFPPDDRLYAGKGGVARRATLVSRIRKDNPNTLLIDAGRRISRDTLLQLLQGRS